MHATLERPTLLRVSEVAERLSVDRASVYRWIKQGRIPAVRLGDPGAPLRVDERELERFLYFDPRDSA